MKKTNNEHLIWSSNIHEELGSDSEIMTEWNELCDINEWDKNWKDNEDKARENAYETVNDYLECIWMDIEFHNDGHKTAQYLIIADIGRWDGRYDGGSIVSGLQNAVEKCISGEDYSKIYVKNNHLYVNTANHDGSSFFKIVRLTKKGEDCIEKASPWISNRELHQRLIKDRHYWNCAGKTFKEVYGW